MARRKQLSLVPKTWSKHHFSFGASLLKGSHPKKKRPFRAKLPMHLVMKSSQACGRKSLLRFNFEIEHIIETLSKRHGVRLMGAANGGNHLHLLIQAPSREALNAFVRGVTGRIAKLVGLARQARATQAGVSSTIEAPVESAFWDARPFSRLVSWGRDLKNVCRYLGINAMETLLGMPRGFARSVAKDIQSAVEAGWLRKSPELQAAGFV